MNFLEALATGKRVRLPTFPKDSWVQQRGPRLFNNFGSQGEEQVSRVPSWWLLIHDWEVVAEPELVEYFEVLQEAESYHGVDGVLYTEEEVVRQKLTPTGRSWRLPRKVAP